MDIGGEGTVVPKNTLNNEGNKIFLQAGSIEGGTYNFNILPDKQAETKIKELTFAIPLRLPFSWNPNFMGREDELKAIDKYFTESVSGARDAPTICALVGTDGMGKTQIALRYAYQHSRRFTAIFWISAATEEAVRISFVDIMQQIVNQQAKIFWSESAPDYDALGVRLGIPGLIDSKGTITSEVDANNLQTALFYWLQLPRNRNWLLIFDNADDLETFSVDNYFPKHGGGAILVTSRRPEFSSFSQQVDLDGLDRASAVKLLLRLAQLPDTQDDAMVVVEKLGYMPLAISHAGCFMHGSKISPTEYLRYYETAFMDIQSKKPKLGWNYQNGSAATTWELSFSEVKRQDEKSASLLLMCSYLNPYQISDSLWNNENVESQLRHKNRISLLASYSLIKNSYAGTFSVHPVVHTWARERLSHADQLQVMRDVVKVIGKALKREELSRESSKWNGQEERKMVEHAEHLDRYLKPKFAEFLEHEGQNTTILSDVHSIGMLFEHQFKYDEAMQWYERAFASGEKVLGENHLLTLATNNSIGILLLQQKRYDEAIQRFERILAGYKESFNHGHEDIFYIMNNIAGALSIQAKYDEALPWYEQALDGKEKALGKNHPSTLVIVNNIAATFYSQGEYAKAMQWFELALDGREKALGKNHPDTLLIVHNIATIFFSQGEYAKAMQWFERALAGQERILGKNHPDTLLTVYNIATTFYSQGEYTKAMQWFERALVGGERIILGTGLVVRRFGH